VEKVEQKLNIDKNEKVLNDEAMIPELLKTVDNL